MTAETVAFYTVCLNCVPYVLLATFVAMVALKEIFRR